MFLKSDEIEGIIAEYLPEVKKIAHKYYMDGGSDDDLVQEGLIGLVDGIKSFDESKGKNNDAFKSFVLMCAKRQILDAIKRANSNKNMPLNNFLSLSEDYDEKADAQSNLIQTPEDIVLAQIEHQEKANSIFIMLSKSEKQVLDLYLDGCKQSEIAVKLNKTVKSIDNSLQRIKNKIKGRG